MYLIVFVTVPSEEVGAKIARILIREKLAACVNINPNIRSIYTWEDKLQDESEALLIIKTKIGLYNELEQVIKKNHPYSVPEIIGFPISCGYRAYLEWISKETKITENDPRLRMVSF